MKPIVMILCGGVGSRLWPLSRKNLPKQFLNIFQGKTLFEHTLERASLLTTPDQIWVLTTQNLESCVRQYLRHPEIRVILEPYSKNTGSALGYAMTYVADPTQPCIVMPADHWIPKEDFARDVKILLKNVLDSLVLFGIPPFEPSTQYGYIECYPEESQSFRAVKSFIEKPPLEKAQVLVQNPHVFWNAGIFVWTKQLFFSELKGVSPRLHEWVSQLESGSLSPTEFFEKLPSLSIDHLLFEHSPNVKCFLGSFDWRDLGTWRAVYQFLSEHHLLNSQYDDHVIQIDSESSLIFNRCPEKQVFALGLKEHLLVVTQDSVVCLPLSQSHRVSELLSAVQKQGLLEFL